MKTSNLSIFLLFLISQTSNGATIYVTQLGGGLLNGSSWLNALAGNQLQNAINNAVLGDEIWVASGTYFTTSTTNRTISFRMRNGISIYGSFAGTEALLSQRTLTNGISSILSGEIGVPGFADNSYHTVSNITGTNTTALLDGFVIRDANDNRTATIINGLGGGVYNNGGYAGNSCNPTIRNCLIRNNRAQFGAGIFNSGHSGGVSSPQIINCIITENYAYLGGGGIDNFGLAGTASPLMINTILYNNTAVQRAGGMYCWGGNNGNASPTLINCTITNNTAADGGGLVSDRENSPAGSFSGNSNPIFLNCILSGNIATNIGPQFFIIGNATVQATYTCVDLVGQAAPHVLSGATTGNINVNPLFSSQSVGAGADGIWFTDDDGLQLQYNSPLINAGTLSGAVLNDIRNFNRIGNPDMGSYEFLNSHLTLRLFLQGYFQGSGTMINTLYLQGIENTPSLNVDTIALSLVSPLSLTSIFIQKKLVATNGYISFDFPPPIQGGSYYLKIQHRNSVETWSASPILFQANGIYDFTNASNKAFGSNMIQVEPGVWAFYSGDINQDENLDLLDLSILQSDINGFLFGYLATDMNGDGNVDLLDSPVVEANINNFIYSAHP